MWQCTSKINANKQAIRTSLVIAVIFFIFVIYVNMDNSFDTYVDFQPTFQKTSNKTSRGKNPSKVLDFSEDNTNDQKAVNDVTFENDIFKWLLLSKSNSNDNRSLTKPSNQLRTKKVWNRATEYSTEAPSSTEKTSSRDTRAKLSAFGKNQNDNNATEIHKEKSRGTDWMKIKQRPLSRKPKQIPMSILFPSFLTFDKSAYDIMNMEPIPFDRTFKNPCFRGTDDPVPIKDGRLHCLPYFYIIGVKKSGTSDLYSRLKSHPELCTPSFPKESQWFARFRFGIKAFSMNNRRIMSTIQRGIDPRKVEFFASLFDRAARCIHRGPSRYANDSLYYNKITVEASPSTLHMQTKWELLPGNENLQEPRYTNFHYIKHITPKAKIIILFRDPTSRLYSDFLHSTRGKYGESSGRVFHKHVIELIKAYDNCFNHSSHRSCVYNNTLRKTLRLKRNELAESFNAGFYSVFMKDLLDVFGTSQILPILMSDYITKMEQTLEDVFRFLDMSPVSSLTMQRILKLSTKNVSAKKRKTGPLLESTKAILDDFYRPYNKDMAELLKDNRYLFLE